LGEIVAELGSEFEYLQIVTAMIDLSLVEEIRREVPLVRRTNLYCVPEYKDVIGVSVPWFLRGSELKQIETNGIHRFFSKQKLLVLAFCDFAPLMSFGL
jgi:hypothetical protein